MTGRIGLREHRHHSIYLRFTCKRVIIPAKSDIGANMTKKGRFYRRGAIDKLGIMARKTIIGPDSIGIKIPGRGQRSPVHPGQTVQVIETGGDLSYQLREFRGSIRLDIQLQLGRNALSIVIESPQPVKKYIDEQNDKNYPSKKNQEPDPVCLLFYQLPDDDHKIIYGADQDRSIKQIPDTERYPAK